jgi:hypothetical protein
MINEAHEPSSACRLRRIFQVETSAPPSNMLKVAHARGLVKEMSGISCPGRRPRPGPAYRSVAGRAGFSA